MRHPRKPQSAMRTGRGIVPELTAKGKPVPRLLGFIGKGIAALRHVRRGKLPHSGASKENRRTPGRSKEKCRLCGDVKGKTAALRGRLKGPPRRDARKEKPPSSDFRKPDAGGSAKAQGLTAPGALRERRRSSGSIKGGNSRPASARALRFLFSFFCHNPLQSSRLPQKEPATSAIFYFPMTDFPQMHDFPML